ncbi:IclR family transcriptional regulator [Pseudaestuariivita atlantica]|uniref:IclR family transcriptional regulator n=1 Tax=Pseudaestuariivita atlantica TaxID=1317121 RepID=A0A0L1JRQ4_9RHOB|nr:IclR family transcriptional regulator [Pseudaestuariivita atlantica]KNG94078.1 IclR family transcriptional regulator [Pseudaestuariivita atlantica]
MNVDKRIPTNLRTLLILEIVGRSDSAMSPTEINAELGLPKQTVHRLVATLEREGFLIRDADRNKFRPARRARMMASGLLYASRASIARHQILEDVAAEVKEAVNFVVPEASGMNYLDRVETNWPFRIQLPRGTNVPFHCTASGKTFMASLSPAKRRTFVQSLSLDGKTANTHTTPDTLLDELAQIARQGYAIDNEEFMDNMFAIAVPVTDDDGRFCAALATHGPKSRLNESHVAAGAQVLKTAATRLRATMFDEETAPS